MRCVRRFPAAEADLIEIGLYIARDSPANAAVCANLMETTKEDSNDVGFPVQAYGSLALRPRGGAPDCCR